MDISFIYGISVFINTEKQFVMIRNIGDEVSFYYNGKVCKGTIVASDHDIYTISFSYKEEGKAPVNILYDLTEIEILK